MARFLEPFELEILRLESGGVGVGEAPDGRPIHVRAAPPGSRLRVVPYERRKGVWKARRDLVVRPAPEAVAPRCAQFGPCGGCALQEVSADGQASLKHDLALREIARGLGGDLAARGVIVHPPRRAPAGFGYRNRVELTFGNRRWLTEAEQAAGLPMEGRFLGFHAPARFDRVVDAPRCELVSEAANQVITVLREGLLDDALPPVWDPKKQAGYWRHVMIREARGGALLVVIYTASGEEPRIDAVATRLLAAALPDGARVVGVQHVENDGVADVARGAVRQTWGFASLDERLGGVTFRLSPTSFFQTNTAGAEVLYDAVGEALGDAGGTLLDLYCGIGSIGAYLSTRPGARFDEVIGIEENPAAVEDAITNAARNGLTARYVASKVEDALAAWSGRPAVVVDPPRVGLHPKVTKALAAFDASALVYVACNPGSLGRDGAVLEAGGYRLAELWTVDLFPQTGHVEAVGRFVRG